MHALVGTAALVGAIALAVGRAIGRRERPTVAQQQLAQHVHASTGGRLIPFHDPKKRIPFNPSRSA